MKSKQLVLFFLILFVLQVFSSDKDHHDEKNPTIYDQKILQNKKNKMIHILKMSCLYQIIVDFLLPHERQLSLKTLSKTTYVQWNEKHQKQFQNDMFNQILTVPVHDTSNIFTMTAKFIQNYRDHFLPDLDVLSTIAETKLKYAKTEKYLEFYHSEKNTIRWKICDQILSNKSQISKEDSEYHNFRCPLCFLVTDSKETMYLLRMFDLLYMVNDLNCSTGLRELCVLVMHINDKTVAPFIWNNNSGQFEVDADYTLLHTLYWETYVNNYVFPDLFDDSLTSYFKSFYKLD